MFCTVNIVLFFLLLKFSSSDQLTRSYGHVNYRRNEQQLQNASPVPLDPQQLNEENNDSDHPDGKIVQLNEENVQLIPVPNQPLNEGNGQQVISESPAPSLVTAAKIPPQKVNFVQEKTGQRWPMGVVPYFIDKNTYDPTTVRRIVKEMAAIESYSCVIFRELAKKPEDSNDAWLHFTNPEKERECVHEFTTSQTEGTEVVLGFDCLHPNEILHSLLHAIGFNDEVSHPHRDQYIRVLWENIQPKYRQLYRIRYEDVPYKLVEYDPMSIMHFHDRAFSANGAATIAALVPGLQLTTTHALSQLDAMKLKLAFSHECNKRKIGYLLDTCKNSLSLSKKKPDDVAKAEAESLKEEHGIGGHSQEEVDLEDGEHVNEAERIVEENDHETLAEERNEEVKIKSKRIPNRFKSVNG